MFNLQELKAIVKDLERIKNNYDDDFIITDFAQGYNDRYIIIEWKSGEREVLTLKEIL